MRVVGVDPGLRGAIALIDDAKVVSITKMPVYKVKNKIVYDLPWIVDLLRVYAPDLVVIEAVTRPGTLVGNRNFIHGASMALGYEVQVVSSPVWKRWLLVGAAKNESRLAAQVLWPDYGFDKLNKGQDGFWEAALIAEYGRVHA